MRLNRLRESFSKISRVNLFLPKHTVHLKVNTADNFFAFRLEARRHTCIPETINESLLMNKIVGRVADRSACNRKENRIKRALNGAIIRGDGDEGAQRNAQSGLRGLVMARMCRDTEESEPEPEITAAPKSFLVCFRLCPFPCPLSLFPLYP